MLMELTMAAAVAGGSASDVERRIAERLASFQGAMKPVYDKFINDPKAKDMVKRIQDTK